MSEPQHAQTADRCPVCGRPAGTDAQCRDCGWTLNTPWRLGRGDEAGFRARLDAARLAADLQVAARLGDDWRDIAPLLRGVPDDAAWAEARGAVSVPVRPARPVLTRAVTDLAGGARLAVIEVSAEGLTATLVDDMARDHGPLRGRSWTEVLPMLSADPAERAFQLAGGERDLDRPALEPALAAALTAWARTLPPERVAICRVPGWPLPELATRLLAPRRLATATAAEPGELPELLTAVAATRPIRTGYGLLVARLDPKGHRVTAELHPLLDAGARGGAMAEVTVHRAPGMSPATTFAVCTVERPPRLVAAWRATLRTGPVQVRVVLDGPERVRLTAPAEVKSEPQDLSGILEGLPKRFVAPPRRLELFCLLELNGPATAVWRRRKLLDGLLDLLAAEVPDRVDAAVLGYSDHSFRGRTIIDVVHGGGAPEPLAAARSSLKRLPDPVEPFTAGAAPLEDALTALASTVPPPRAPRVLLTVAGRPPHPLISDRSGRRPVDVCPSRHDWSKALARTHTGRRVAVVDEVTESPAPVWRTLGEHGLLGLDGADPRALAAALGLLPSAPVRFSVPLAHPL
ncbi:hypothetical protein BZB76_1114 [Actinomadura pelletieri DSM 43383]|uniref:Uncharacterized protein n=1 Tax=Actinomadura pelletieri DSM 43383 TaxID=1120940 RepID=A0A495QZJ1_9ACTN|nr:hypothetical protein [Actinomadura pelletieri]RKS79639.1 hypothetical protein BZB76_1114 [Actinomadura pelletieri DSM 43383]